MWSAGHRTFCMKSEGAEGVLYQSAVIDVHFAMLINNPPLITRRWAVDSAF